MYIDTHCHYEDEAFDADREEVIEKIRAAGCAALVDCAQDYETSVKILEMAEKYDFMYAAVGIHPEQADTFSRESIDKIKKLCNNKKVVAIGETGLDYHWDNVPRERQQENFRANIRLSKELGLPLVVHDRDAHRDTLDIMIEEDVPPGMAVLHCFSGSREMAEEVASRGWYFSFGGAVTFKSAKKFPEIIRSIPDELLMIETDAPYMAPEPLRGRRNDSSLLPHVIAKIAEIKNVNVEEVKALTTANAKRFFGLC